MLLEFPGDHSRISGIDTVSKTIVVFENVAYFLVKKYISQNVDCFII